MINVISSEFYKIFKSKVFFVISIILLVFNAIGTISTIVIKNSVSFTEDRLATGIDNYAGSFDGDIIFYFIFIFVACLITAEYSNSTIRQMVGHGIARWKLVLGQYIAISSVITVMLIVFASLNLLSDSILNQFGKVDIFDFILMNLGTICMIWSISGLGTLFSYLFKSSGITIAISLFFLILCSLAAQLLTFLTKNDVFFKYTLSSMRSVIIDFSSTPEDIAKYTFGFLLIAIATVFGTIILFTKRDID